MEIPEEVFACVFGHHPDSFSHSLVLHLPQWPFVTEISGYLQLMIVPIFCFVATYLMHSHIILGMFGFACC